ncbi:hypothetical protein Ocin01_18241, partial [Orchesella cincta]
MPRRQYYTRGCFHGADRDHITFTSEKENQRGQSGLSMLLTYFWVLWPAAMLS